MHGTTIVHGHHVKHKGKMHQLYHHNEKGYGILDSVGNFIKKAYNVAKNVHSHLKEKKYAKQILDNPYSSLIHHIPVVGSHLHGALQLAEKHGYGKQKKKGYGQKLKTLHVPMIRPVF